MTGAETNPLEERVGYRLARQGTGLGVGWFDCVPEREWGLKEGLDFLRRRPYDLFMHRHVLKVVCSLGPADLECLFRKGLSGDRTVLAVAAEALLTQEGFAHLRPLLADMDWQTLKDRTPLAQIPWSRQDFGSGHFYWLSRFAHNSIRHEALPVPGAAEFPIPYDADALSSWTRKVVPIGTLRSPTEQETDAAPDPAQLRAVCRDLSRRFEELGVLQGWEARTEATVSPYAVERPWRMAVQTAVGRNRWRLEGLQTSYGRGFNIHQARISCLMEVAERFSAFAGFDGEVCPDYECTQRLVKGSFSSMRARGLPVLDPNTLMLEVPYGDEDMYWVMGERCAAGREEKIYVPAQLVFLFSNLDERCLTSGISSTGLGAGSSMAGARLSALLEVIERDAEKVVPFREESCFLLDAEDLRAAETLDAFARKGIIIQFREMIPEFGIPCYQAFISGPGGAILKGSAAHLDGRHAILAALTEVPYPYPYWFGAMPPPRAIERRRLRDLPDYACGDAEDDLGRVEEVLGLNGYFPIYVNLTRRDLQVPVCRAIVPGLEMMTLYDRFTPLGLRQFGHYLKSFPDRR